MAGEVKESPVEDADGWAATVRAMTYDFLIDDRVSFSLAQIQSMLFLFSCITCMHVTSCSRQDMDLGRGRLFCTVPK